VSTPTQAPPVAPTRNLRSARTAAQLRRMLALRWRTGRLPLIVWVLGIAGTVLGTAVGVAAVYDTPAGIHAYAVAVTSGNALAAINGHVEGIESLGGIIQDEFGFIASFLLPLSGISLVAGATRREEESGRSETLLAGTLSRAVPTAAALIVALAAITLTGVLVAGAVTVVGVPAQRAALYALSLATLAAVFAALAAVVAQLTRHSRSVYTVCLVVLLGGYVLRGVGDVTGSAVTWLSPLGWAERAAPFGGTRWWVPVIPLAVTAALSGLALRLAAHRDLGASALGIGGRGPRPVHLSGGPGRLAWRIHLPILAAWTAGSVILAGMLGLLAQQILDAVAGTPALAEVLGVASGSGADRITALAQLYLGLLSAGYAVHAVTVLRAEEVEGRLEQVLAGGISRHRWLAGQELAVVTGGVLLALVGSGVLAWSVAASTGTAPDLPRTGLAGLAYLLAAGVPAACGLALFAVRPRWSALAWGIYAATVFVATLGPGLDLAPWLLDLAPVTHLDSPPAGTPPLAAVLVLASIVLGLGVIGHLAFRRRDLPTG